MSVALTVLSRASFSWRELHKLESRCIEVISQSAALISAAVGSKLRKCCLLPTAPDGLHVTNVGDSKWFACLL